MGDADDLLFVTKRYESLLVLKPDHARGPEARYAEAREFMKKMRLSASLPRFGIN
jgi:hypothetical protein